MNNPEQLRSLLLELADIAALGIEFNCRLFSPDDCKKMSFVVALARAAAAELGEQRGEYRFAVTVNDDWMAGGSAPTREQAEREAKHYLSQYEFDGNCIAVIEHCVEVVRFGGGEVKPKQ